MTTIDKTVNLLDFPSFYGFKYLRNSEATKQKNDKTFNVYISIMN